MQTNPDQSPHSLSDAVKDNIDSVAAFYSREEAKISGTQSAIEKISYRFGSPLYFGGFILFVIFWCGINLLMKYQGQYPFDPPPFFWLQGFCGLNSVLITIAVLIRQNRMSRLEESRTHLNLQVNLLAEQKTTKLIQLIEELRRDLPNVKNRHDPEVETMQMQTNPHAMLNAIEAQKVDKLDG
ncbi:MAG: DUF1003 domain-containing protein [Burkholderiaceae bacterium]